MFTPVLGAIADHFGVAASVLAIAALALIAFVLALWLPSESRSGQRSPGKPSVASAA
jgi:predicted MFS family arabinose efflux permease